MDNQTILQAIRLLKGMAEQTFDDINEIADGNTIKFLIQVKKYRLLKRELTRVMNLWNVLIEIYEKQSDYLIMKNTLDIS